MTGARSDGRRARPAERGRKSGSLRGGWASSLRRLRGAGWARERAAGSRDPCPSAIRRPCPRRAGCALNLRASPFEKTGEELARGGTFQPSCRDLLGGLLRRSGPRGLCLRLRGLRLRPRGFDPLRSGGSHGFSLLRPLGLRSLCAAGGSDRALEAFQILRVRGVAPQDPTLLTVGAEEQALHPAASHAPTRTHRGGGVQVVLFQQGAIFGAQVLAHPRVEVFTNGAAHREDRKSVV